jgi:hypothetical protein
MYSFPSKFLRILQHFSPSELKSFEEWLRSPWCNSNKNLPRLLAYLKPYYPDFSNPQLSKEKLFQQVLPKGKFSERRMNNLLSEAYLAAEVFLTVQGLSKSLKMQQDLLAREFQQRGLEDWFFKRSAQQLEQLDVKPVKDPSDHFASFELYQRLYQHPQPEAKVQEAHTWLEKMDTHLDLFYLLEKAALINEMIFRSRLYREVSYDLSSELKKWQQAVAGLQHPALDLYQMRFAYTDQELLPQYLELKTALLQRFDELSPKEQITQLLSLINDAKMLIKAGILDITESLPLYQLGLSSGAILSQGKISTNTYMTIVSASNTQGTFDFTSHFMDTYTPCLPAEAQNDCAHWAKAHTAYWQKDLQACLAILQMYPFEALQFQLTGRVLCTQAHFDLYLSDPSYQFYLLNYLDAFEKWLSRDKILAKPNTLSFLRFVQACRTLVRYHSGPEPNVQKLEKLLGNDVNIQALNWLKERTSAVLNLKKKRPFKS